MRQTGIKQRYEDDEFEDEFHCSRSNGSSSSESCSDTSEYTRQCNSLSPQPGQNKTNTNGRIRLMFYDKLI